jgi:hypothetical protein
VVERCRRQGASGTQGRKGRECRYPS